MWKSLKDSKTGLIGVIIVLAVFITAVTATLIVPYDPAKQDLVNKLMNPVFAGGTTKHLLGTDQLGRDILSRIIYGSRVTILVAFSGTICAGILGITLGALAGYYGKWVDSVIMRIVDIQLSFPFVLLALFVAAVLGRSLRNIILIAAISNWVQYARLIRGEILSVREMEYIEAIRSVGGKNGRIILYQSSDSSGDAGNGPDHTNGGVPELSGTWRSPRNSDMGKNAVGRPRLYADKSLACNPSGNCNHCDSSRR